jgi:hypothetical protein
MKFLSAIALLAATAVANPVARATKKEFHLKTTGSAKADHNDLFVFAYHTGAGLNDAVLDKKAASASPFYLNGTTALADLGTDYPWGIEIGGDTNYACECLFIPRFDTTTTNDLLAWEAVEINAGAGVKGFSIKDGNFVWSEAEGFGGWLGK